MNMQTKKCLNMQNFIVEVTRRCNMSCAHCLRGDAQDTDLNLDRLDHFLDSVNAIDTITFTGGEPTLNVPAIAAILQKCKAKNIPVREFYLVTNGKQVSDAFLTTMIEWYAYCIECGGEPDMCGVALSKDMFHQAIDPVNRLKLSAFSFFRDTDKKTDWNRLPLLNLGRAKDISAFRKHEHKVYMPVVEIDADTLDVVDGSVTFTVKGDLLGDCDYEYENTESIRIGTWDTAAASFLAMVEGAASAYDCGSCA